jgi:hypothetical protein
MFLGDMRQRQAQLGDGNSGEKHITSSAGIAGFWFISLSGLSCLFPDFIDLRQRQCLDRFS